MSLRLPTFLTKSKSQKPSKIAKPSWIEGALVILPWIGTVILFRYLLMSLLNDAWLGSVGAVSLSLTLYLTALRYTPLSAYKARFAQVFRYWYSAKYLIFSLAIFAVNMGVLLMIEYGYTHYGPYIAAHPASMQVDPALVQLVYHEIVAEQVGPQVPITDWSFSPFERTAVTYALVDHSTGGLLRTYLVFVLFEDIEVMLFLILIQKGIIFKRA